MEEFEYVCATTLPGNFQERCVYELDLKPPITELHGVEEYRHRAVVGYGEEYLVWCIIDDDGVIEKTEVTNITAEHVEEIEHSINSTNDEPTHRLPKLLQSYIITNRDWISITDTQIKTYILAHTV